MKKRRVKKSRTMKVFDSGKSSVRNRFVNYNAQPTRELRWELRSDWDGEFRVRKGDVKGARIKPVILIPEEAVSFLDRHAIRQKILDFGAVYCKVPIVHVLRERVKRDDRHRVELSLEESLRIFAEETRPEDPEGKVKFAAALAREADSGERN